MLYLKNVEKYGRWSLEIPLDSGAETMEITKPDHTIDMINLFYHQPSKLCYDDHGYERVELDGIPVLCARYTPALVGNYQFRILKQSHLLDAGEFACCDSKSHGYVERSQHDSRYFAYSDGKSFCAIGLNMAYPTSFELSNGHEFGLDHHTGTMGIAQYKRWFKELASNGGNFARIWLGHSYFCLDTENAGEIRYEQFIKIDTLVEEARKWGIRLKFTFEHFRFFGDNGPSLFFKRFRDQNGAYCENMAQWLTQDRWQSAWFHKIQAYMDRYANDPVVMVWELWNEMNCVSCDFGIVKDWTQKVLTRIKALSPKNLVTNSLGSYDCEAVASSYHAFKMDEMDFQQVHRYLDQGAKLEICKKNPFEFTADAMIRARREDRPIVLAETGAVNDCHSGPFRYCHADHRGIIFNDVTFTPFFAGAAGLGQCWHWDGRYVDAKCLVKYYAPFENMVRGLDIDKENFVSYDLSNEAVWCRVLKGEHHLLGYIRNKEDSWYNVLRDGNEVHTIPLTKLDLTHLGIENGELQTFPLWEDDYTTMKSQNGMLVASDITYGSLFKVKLAEQL